MQTCNKEDENYICTDMITGATGNGRSPKCKLVIGNLVTWDITLPIFHQMHAREDIDQLPFDHLYCRT